MFELLLYTTPPVLIFLIAGLLISSPAAPWASTPRPRDSDGERVERISCGYCKSELPSEALPSRFESFDWLRSEPCFISHNGRTLLFCTTHGSTVTPFECPGCGYQKHIVYTTLSSSPT